jgi:hypothetical protein
VRGNETKNWTSNITLLKIRVLFGILSYNKQVSILTTKENYPIYEKYLFNNSFVDYSVSFKCSNSLWAVATPFGQCLLISGEQQNSVSSG